MKDFSELEKIKELLASYVLGDLTSEEMEQVQKLLRQQPMLQKEIDSLQQTLALFPLGLPEVQLPPDLGARILEQAKTEIERHKQPSLFKSRERKWLTIAGTIAGGIIVSLGLVNYHLQQRVTALHKQLLLHQDAIAFLGQGNINLVSLKGTELNPDAEGRLIAIPESQTIFVTIQNVTPLPKNKIYRLWGIVNNKKVFCGEFLPDKQGNIFIKFPLDDDMANSSGVIITIEPEQKIPYPTGETIIRGHI